MFNEISKILKSIKKGVVIVENGEPSYVLIPFKDFKNYQIQASSKKILKEWNFSAMKPVSKECRFTH